MQDTDTVDPTTWRFGAGQTSGEHFMEIANASAAGMLDQYDAAADEAIGTSTNDHDDTAKVGFLLTPPSPRQCDPLLSSSPPTTGAPNVETKRVSEVEELLRLQAKEPIVSELAALPPLPAGATRPMIEIAEFFALVLALRREAGMPAADEVPFAVEWVAEKCGIPAMTVSRALHKLKDAGVIVWDGDTLSKTKTRLWRPGRVEVRQVEQDSASETHSAPTAGTLLRRALDRAEIGNRNATGFWLACQLRDNGVSYVEAREVMGTYARSVPQGARERYAEREAVASWRQAYARAPRSPARCPQGTHAYA